MCDLFDNSIREIYEFNIPYTNKKYGGFFVSCIPFISGLFNVLLLDSSRSYFVVSTLVPVRLRSPPTTTYGPSKRTHWERWSLTTEFLTVIPTIGLGSLVWKKWNWVRYTVSTPVTESLEVDVPGETLGSEDNHDSGVVQSRTYRSLPRIHPDRSTWNNVPTEVGVDLIRRVRKSISLYSRYLRNNFAPIRVSRSSFSVRSPGKRPMKP